MQDLMFLLAAAMPEEMIIEQLDEALTEYKLDKTKEKLSKVTMIASLLMSKQLTESEGVEKILSDTKKMRDGMELLSPKDQ